MLATDIRPAQRQPCHLHALHRVIPGCRPTCLTLRVWHPHAQLPEQLSSRSLKPSCVHAVPAQAMLSEGTVKRVCGPSAAHAGSPLPNVPLDKRSRTWCGPPSDRRAFLCPSPPALTPSILLLLTSLASSGLGPPRWRTSAGLSASTGAPLSRDDGSMDGLPHGPLIDRQASTDAARSSDTIPDCLCNHLCATCCMHGTPPVH